MKNIKKFDTFNKSDNYDWDDFCTTYGLSKEDLYKRTYSVDNSEPTTLKQLIIDNSKALMVDIIDLGDEIPLSDILDLKPNESDDQIGNEIKRIN